MKVAVTGATGFIGGTIAARLAAQGHDVLALGRRPVPAGFAHAYARWDLAGGAPAPAELATCDAVVHAAARVDPWGEDGPFIAATVAGTGRLLDAITARARLVVIGTASVYDPRLPRIGAREDEAPVPAERYLNAYARAKAAQERLVTARRPDAVILRPRAVWGPGDTTLLPRVLARVRAGRLPLPSGGRNPMSATHVGSLTTVVEAALAHPGVQGAVNVADATPTTAAALLGHLASARGTPIRIVPVPPAAAWAAAGALEWAWTTARRRTEPPLTRFAVAALARPFTLDLRRLHEELGVAPDADLRAEAARLVAGPP